MHTMYISCITKAINRRVKDHRSVPLNKEQESSRLAQISESILRCGGCQLSLSRKNAVPGEGPPSWIMFVGEAPGSQEDREGRPFVGSAGRSLDDLLSIAGIRRESVFITNVVKCRPPSNRMPKTNEISACRTHLKAQLDVIRPRLVCTLGGVALRSILGMGSVMQARGKPVLRNGILYLPMIHPAASLYDPKLKDVLGKDFELLGRLVEAGPDNLESQLANLRGIKTLDSFT